MAEIMKKRAEKIKERIREAIKRNDWAIKAEGSRGFSVVTMYDGTENDGDYEIKIQIDEENAIVTATSFFLKNVSISDDIASLINELNSYVSIGAFIIRSNMIGFRSDFSYHDSLISVWAISDFLSNIEYCIDNADDLLERFAKGERSFHFCEEEFSKRLGIYYDGYFTDTEAADKQYHVMLKGVNKSGYEINLSDEISRMCRILKYDAGVPLEIYSLVIGEGCVIRFVCHIGAEFKEENLIDCAKATLLLSNLAKIGTCEIVEDHIALKVDIHYFESIISPDLIGYMLDEVVEFGETYGGLIYKLADEGITYEEFAKKVLTL